jgi:sulfatase maturation enzyme AslB (radical SAM superfamily)
MKRKSIRSIEWLVTEHCNFSCSYCGLYNNTKPHETDEVKLINFLKQIKAKQYLFDFTFFLFGGEPFLHNKISFIIDSLNDLKIDYLIQSNLSNISISKIIENDISSINFSIHPSQMSLDNVISNLSIAFDNNVNINAIEIMFSSISDLQFYRDLCLKFPNHISLFILCPVSDFLVEGFSDILSSFNFLRDKTPDVNFESILIPHPLSSDLIERSVVWQEFTDKKWSPKGNLCIMKDDFLMFDSNLDIFNCCFHDFIDEPFICPYDTCFLS